VLRKAAEMGYGSEDFQGISLNDKEIVLISALASFPEVIKQAGKEYSPSLIANYTYDLVKEYNQFYHDYSILKEEDAAVRSMRIVLSRSVAKVIKQAMALLGIGVPDKM
jgi:arginyl-tRNA synthetase